MRPLKIEFLNHFFTRLLLVMLPVLFSCEKEEIRSKDYLSGVTEVKIKGENLISASEKTKEITSGQTINFLVYHTSYDGCGFYSRNETYQQGNDLEITFYAKNAASSAVCTDNLKTIETEFKYTPLQKGTYHLRFRQQKEDTYLIYIIIVK